MKQTQSENKPSGQPSWHNIVWTRHDMLTLKHTCSWHKFLKKNHLILQSFNNQCEMIRFKHKAWTNTLGLGAWTKSSCHKDWEKYYDTRLEQTFHDRKTWTISHHVIHVVWSNILCHKTWTNRLCHVRLEQMLWYDVWKN